MWGESWYNDGVAKDGAGGGKGDIGTTRGISDGNDDVVPPYSRHAREEKRVTERLRGNIGANANMRGETTREKEREKESKRMKLCVAKQERENAMNKESQKKERERERAYVQRCVCRVSVLKSEK